jgi:hypothetical protein
MKQGARLVLFFLFGLLAGLSGEALLLLRQHCLGAETALAEDFRVLAFVKESVSDSKLKVLEERLRSMPHVKETRFVSADESLAALREQEPELVESVTWLGENPLPAAFEVRLDPGSLARFPEWLGAAETVLDDLDVRYKAGQVRAVMQLQFYGHFLTIVLCGALCLAALAAVTALSWTRSPLRFSRHAPSTLTTAAGAAAGIGAACLLVLPMKAHFAWWAVPDSGAQLTLLGGATLLGLTMSPWLSGE